ncbi:hypothetical protein EYF80_034430 [Liparis tanakae]|uniref:Uncharacterized protein n=1 Tax=Liparis tanakae TaxID=230148 RepID=A0A4Z2GP77_9TELE|nr:hypothetical protein EYF80_034430 [Liparis tanakae]
MFWGLIHERFSSRSPEHANTFASQAVKPDLSTSPETHICSEPVLPGTEGTLPPGTPPICSRFATKSNN